MPQMAPMNWLMLFFMFLLIFMMFIYLNYYSFMKTEASNISVKTIKTSLNWKW